MGETYLLNALADLQTSKALLEKYKNSGAKGYKINCMYHIQQCIEKSLKHCLELKNSYVMRTHDIKRLVESCESADLGIKIPKIIVLNSKTITDWNLIGRYDIRISRRIDFIESILDSTKELYFICKKYKVE